jgi:PAS domain S-box-containing protein
MEARGLMTTQNIYYRELLDNLYDGVFFVDSNKTITYWNRAAENITGYTCEDVVGKAAPITSWFTLMKRGPRCTIQVARCRPL